MSYRLVIADDATGALEAGALLADAGIAASISLSPSQARTSAVSIVLLLTRHLSPPLARQLTVSALARLGAGPGVDLYWKTDSTLRGPIGACFDELLRVFPGHQLVYCPAYPALGRTVRDGVLYVHGVPLADTEFAADPHHPVDTSRIRQVIVRGCDAPLRLAAGPGDLRAHLTAGTGGIVICDAQTEDDVAALFDICRRHYQPVLYAGPAGGIRHWVQAPGRSTQVHRPRVDQWTVLCGSLHPVSRAQAAAAAALGLRVLCTPAKSDTTSGRELDTLARAAAATASQGVIIFGGDTALALWREMGITAIEPLGEILPGVAVSRAGGRVFITKAGGYGQPDLVASVLRKWNT